MFKIRLFQVFCYNNEKLINTPDLFFFTTVWPWAIYLTFWHCFLTHNKDIETWWDNKYETFGRMPFISSTPHNTWRAVISKGCLDTYKVIHAENWVICTSRLLISRSFHLVLSSIHVHVRVFINGRALLASIFLLSHWEPDSCLLLAPSQLPLNRNNNPVKPLLKRSRGFLAKLTAY